MTRSKFFICMMVGASMLSIYFSQLLVPQTCFSADQSLSNVAMLTQNPEEATSVEATEAEPQQQGEGTVIAMANGYALWQHRVFVGSLRQSGFRGHILLGMSHATPPDALDYLKQQNVTVKFLPFVNCTFVLEKGEKEVNTCVDPYPNVKIRWSRYLKIRDWLKECLDCEGPVLISDFRDVVFQRHPFEGVEVNKLQVFQEHWSITTNHWLVSFPVKECKKTPVSNQPMLCAGTTIGTKPYMLQYLNVMEQEMLSWINDGCTIDMVGDDQAVHNYVYYTNKLPFATSVPHRMGIVHTVGAQASHIWTQHSEHYAKQNKTPANQQFYGSNDKNMWLGIGFDLINQDGHLVDHDGKPSRVVHQYDRFGPPYYRWLNQQEGKLWN